MMFFEGNIAAPPTITVFSPDISLFILSCALTGATRVAVIANALNATADRSAIRFDMDISRWIEFAGGFAGDRVNDSGGEPWSDCAVVGRITGAFRERFRKITYRDS